MTELNFEIAVRNESRLDDSDVVNAVQVVDRQMRYDFSPAWGRNAFVEFDQEPEGRDWVINIVDQPTIRGAAGWHSIDRNGRVISEVAVNSGLPWTVVLSHEVLESAANESVSKFVLNRRDLHLYALEVCDPVQRVTYRKDGVEISDFVKPEWFAADASVTDTAHITKRLRPFALARGGYIPRWTQNWQDATIGATAVEQHARLEWLDPTGSLMLGE